MKSKIENPWTKLNETTNYCSSEDLERIKSFNTQLKGNVDYLIDLDLIAEPFLGNKEANVVILGLNPGIYKKKDDTEKDEKDLYSDKDIFKRTSGIRKTG